MNKKDLKISLIFTLIGLIAGVLISYFQLSTASKEFKNQIVTALGSDKMLIVVGTVQSSIFTFISTFFGVKLARKLDLKLYVK